MLSPDLVRRLALQNAATAQALGVDFVPRTEVESKPATQATPAPRSAERPLSAPAPPPSRPFRPPPANAPIAASSKPEPRPAMTGLPPVRTPSPSPVPTSGPRDRVTIRARLDDLRARYERDAPHQHFVTDHTHIVFDDGDCAARLMFIGEAPGADEDRTGVPFVGRAGQLLNKMIAAMGLRREDVYIANVLKTRPPNNATPTSDEIRLCAPYLFEQIAIVRPEVIVTLGLPATRALLESSDSMSRLRGRWYDFTPPGFLTDPIPILPTYHPAFLLRSYTRENREKVWADLRLVMDRLGLLKPGLPTTGDGLESAQGP